MSVKEIKKQILSWSSYSLYSTFLNFLSRGGSKLIVYVTHLKRSLLELHDGGIVDTHALRVDEDWRKVDVIGMIP